MSLIVTVHTNEGIIMASDSRTTYTSTVKRPDGIIENRIGVQITDTTYKTFLCTNRIGISTCGDADINGLPIAGYIETFIAQKGFALESVSDVAQALMDEFSQFSPGLNTIFIVAGYDEIDKKQHICRVYIQTKEIESVNTENAGALWNGEAEILQKLIKQVALKSEDGSYIDLPTYQIGFNFFTLQDAIDFAKYTVDVTIKTMAFQDCVKTVGGPIDILAIKPNSAIWIQRKELHS